MFCAQNGCISVGHEFTIFCEIDKQAQRVSYFDRLWADIK